MVKLTRRDWHSFSAGWCGMGAFYSYDRGHGWLALVGVIVGILFLLDANRRAGGYEGP